MNKPLEPTNRRRPKMPEGYGIPKNEKGMLAWDQVNEMLKKARIYWLATSGPDGEPHANPIWGAWIGNMFYFDGDFNNTRWGRNLAANPRIVVHIESGNFVIMIKGAAEITNVEPSVYEPLAASYASKYPYRPEVGGAMYAIRPLTVMAWDNEDFAKTSTRWSFSPE